MKKLLRISAVTIATVGLMTGVASAQSGSGSVSIENTGRRSDNHIRVRQVERQRVENNNRVNVHNDTRQYARSGDATVNGRRGGDAVTGDASNRSTTRSDVTVNNRSSSAGLLNRGGNEIDANISDTGKRSDNTINVRSSTNTSVVNNNNVNVSNETNQVATSGDATVNSRRGGDAVTRSASNTSTTETTVNIRN